MTVSMLSRDAVGDTGCSSVSGQISAVGVALPPSSVLGALGSRFWALLEEDMDSDEEGVAGSECVSGDSRGGSPRSAPAQRTLGDFMGAEWCVVAAAGRRRAGKQTAFAPGGQCSSFVARVAGSMEKKVPGAMEVDEFPPLPLPLVVDPLPPAPSREMWVGLVVVPLVGVPTFGGFLAAAAMSLVTEVSQTLGQGDMASCHPLMPEKGVDPASQCLFSQGGATLALNGLSLGEAAHSRPIPSPAQLTHPTSLLKWARRPVGTLDPTLLTPTSFSDLARANLLHLTVCAPRIPRSGLLPTMDRSRCDGRDGWDGHTRSKCSFEESLLLEEWRVDSLSQGELRLLLERKERIGYRSPVRMLEAGRFEGDSSRYPQGQNFPKAGEGSNGPRPIHRKVPVSKPKARPVPEMPATSSQHPSM
jgi:hypothetical protein